MMLFVALAAASALAEDATFRGVDVFDAVCARCHVGGEQGAPRIGDPSAWAKRAAQGFSSLSQHALDGIRNMPPHGGDASLSFEVMASTFDQPPHRHIRLAELALEKVRRMVEFGRHVVLLLDSLRGSGGPTTTSRTGRAASSRAASRRRP